MVFRVKQTAQADYDLDLILEWLLAQPAGDAGLRWFWKLKDAIDSLADMPEVVPARLSTLTWNAVPWRSPFSTVIG